MSNLQKIIVKFVEKDDCINPEGEVAFVLCRGSSRVARYEIIHQILEDLVKYEFLILSLFGPNAVNDETCSGSGIIDRSD